MKILFVHNRVMNYRLPFFKEISRLYNVKFYFTRCNEVGGLDQEKYEIIRNPISLIWKLLTNDFDVVVNGETSGISGLLERITTFSITKLRGKKFVQWTVHWNPPRKSLKTRINLCVLSFIVSNSDVVVVPGELHREFILSLGAKEHKVFILPNVSIIPSKENLEKMQEISFNSMNSNVVLYVGRLLDWKGVQFLIKAFAKLKREISGVSLVIVGDGKYKKNLIALCKKLTIEHDVFFLGWIDYQYLELYYSLCNVFVIPSCGKDDWPNVVNEVMYFGKPVIGTLYAGSACNMIKDGINGYLVDGGDSDALYKAIKKVLSNRNLEKMMGQNSKKVIDEGYTYRHMIDSFGYIVNYISST